MDVSFVNNKMKNPLFPVLFREDEDIGMCFCADLSKESNLIGISLYYTRKSKGTVNQTRPEVITDIFKPTLTKTAKKGQFELSIQPLKENIRITQKGTKFSCKYPFKKEGKVGKITHIYVELTKSPLNVTFIIYASYRSAKDSPVETLMEKIVAPKEFTRDLYNMFISY
jgi:hypothetical protein